MDPMQLFMMQQMMHGGGMLPSYGQPQMPQGQLPAMGSPDAQQQHHHGGLSPLMMLSPMAGLMMSHPKAAMFGLSPALGLANLLGAFK